MATTKRQAQARAAQSSPWYDPAVDIATLTAEQAVAHELVLRRRDITPSVQRIMDAPLDATARGVALAAFSRALDTPGDPNRDPRVAIASATGRPA